MPADQRLDQLEPLVSQTLAVADRHTAQLKQLVGIAIQHTDDIRFALQELSEVRQNVGELKKSVDTLLEGQQTTGERFNTVDAAMVDLGVKLDRLIDLFGKG